MIARRTKSQNEEASERNVNKWWEFYAVRYATGTVIGAVIFYALCLSNPTVIGKLLFDVNQIDYAKLILLGLYGFVFCYISSAPILVFHATRVNFIGSKFKNFKLLDWFLIFATLFLSFFVAIQVFDEIKDKSINAYCSGVAFLTALIFFTQMALLIKTNYHLDTLYQYYVKLTAKRSLEKTEIVESYKHLREHGNAFLIVLFEMVFGLALWVFADQLSRSEGVMTNDKIVSSIFYYLAITIIWVTPAALVWFLASRIEWKYSGYEALNVNADKSPAVSTECRNNSTGKLDKVGRGLFVSLKSKRWVAKLFIRKNS